MGLAQGETLAHKDARKKQLEFTVPTTGSNQVELQLQSGGGSIDCFVLWPDGDIDFITSHDDSEKTHFFSSAGDKIVKVYKNGKNGTLGTHTFFGDDVKGFASAGEWGRTSFYQFYYNNTQANSAFPSDIGSWDVSTIENMGYMFYSCTSFDKDIGSWNTSNVTDMSYMFLNCLAFDQDISAWDFTGISTNMKMLYFAHNMSLSTANYDALLVSWANQAANMPSNMTLVTMGSSTYTSGGAGATARTTLVNTYGWSISDGGAV